MVCSSISRITVKFRSTPRAAMRSELTTPNTFLAIKSLMTGICHVNSYCPSASVRNSWLLPTKVPLIQTAAPPTGAPSGSRTVPMIFRTGPTTGSTKTSTMFVWPVTTLTLVCVPFCPPWSTVMRHRLGKRRSRATPSAPVTTETRDGDHWLEIETDTLARGLRSSRDRTVIAATPPFKARTSASFLVSPDETVTERSSATQSATGSPGNSAVMTTLPRGMSAMRNAPSAPLTTWPRMLFVATHRSFTPDTGWPVAATITFPSMLANAWPLPSTVERA